MAEGSKSGYIYNQTSKVHTLNRVQQMIHQDSNLKTRHVGWRLKLTQLIKNVLISNPDSKMTARITDLMT